MEKRKIEEFRGKRMESFYFAVYKGEEGKWPQTCGSYTYLIFVTNPTNPTNEFSKNVARVKKMTNIRYDHIIPEKFSEYILLH